MSERHAINIRLIDHVVLGVKNMDKMIDNTRKNYVVIRQTGSGIHFDYRTQQPKAGKEEKNG